MKRIGKREYESRDGRFHAKWHRRQGAQSCYTVLDRVTGRTLRAFSLTEIRECVEEMRS